MEIINVYKTELDPNNEQAAFFERCCAVSKFVYNIGLMEWEKQYEAWKEDNELGRPSEYGLKKQFNAVKHDNFPWVTEVPYAVTESAFANLGSAYKNFFRRIKQGSDKVGFPRKKRYNNSFALRRTKVKNDRVRLTNIGLVRLKEKGYIPTSATKYGTYSTVSTRAGRWFIAVPVYEEVEITNNNSGIIGVDLGVKSLAVCSNGKIFSNPKALESAQRKLSRLNKELSRRKKGGQNRKKTKDKLSKVHYRVSNIRKNALHEVSSYLIKQQPEIIAIEDLNVKGMVKNHSLARAISDAGMGELRRQIEYKAKRNGIRIKLVDRWYASSKTCSLCGWKNENLKLSDRTFECKECNLTIDRDINAARNIAAWKEP